MLYKKHLLFIAIFVTAHVKGYFDQTVDQYIKDGGRWTVFNGSRFAAGIGVRALVDGLFLRTIKPAINETFVEVDSYNQVNAMASILTTIATCQTLPVLNKYVQKASSEEYIQLK